MGVCMLLRRLTMLAIILALLPAAAARGRGSALEPLEAYAVAEAPRAEPPTPTPTPATAERCLSVRSNAFGQNIPPGGQNVIEGTIFNGCSDSVAGSIRLTRLAKSESVGPNVDGYDRWEI